MNILWLNVRKKAPKAQKFLTLDLFCTHVLMSDKIWSRGCKLWCFQGRGVSGSIDTLSTLARILRETGFGPILEPVSKPVLELVLKSVQEELG